MSNKHLRIQFVSDRLHQLHKEKGIDSKDFMKNKVKEIIEKYPERVKIKPDSFKKEIRIHNIDPDDAIKIKNIASSFGTSVKGLIHYELFSEFPDSL